MWATFYLDRDQFPKRRVLIRFDYPTLPRPGSRNWLLIERGDAEICEKHPGRRGAARCGDAQPGGIRPLALFDPARHEAQIVAHSVVTWVQVLRVPSSAQRGATGTSVEHQLLTHDDHVGGAQLGPQTRTLRTPVLVAIRPAPLLFRDGRSTSGPVAGSCPNRDGTPRRIQHAALRTRIMRTPPGVADAGRRAATARPARPRPWHAQAHRLP